MCNFLKDILSPSDKISRRLKHNFIVFSVLYLYENEVSLSQYFSKFSFSWPIFGVKRTLGPHKHKLKFHVTGNIFCLQKQNIVDNINPD